jgi:hypothetical protein
MTVPIALTFVLYLLAMLAAIGSALAYRRASNPGGMWLAVAIALYFLIAVWSAADATF